MNSEQYLHPNPIAACHNFRYSHPERRAANGSHKYSPTREIQSTRRSPISMRTLEENPNKRRRHPIGPRAQIQMTPRQFRPIIPVMWQEEIALDKQIVGDEIAASNFESAEFNFGRAYHGANCGRAASRRNDTRVARKIKCQINADNKFPGRTSGADVRI